VPEIPEPAALAAAIEGGAWGVRLWLAEPTLEVEAARRVDGLASRAREHGAALAIGPEGGWTPAEVEAAKAAGFVPWSLGPLVLRAESVPLAAMSVLRYAWG
jgi:16S rRNA (uracil1498-N3)-methyltransferase